MNVGQNRIVRRHRETTSFALDLEMYVETTSRSTMHHVRDASIDQVVNYTDVTVEPTSSCFRNKDPNRSIQLTNHIVHHKKCNRGVVNSQTGARINDVDGATQ